MLDPAGIGQVGFIDSFTYYFVIIAEFGITTYGIREVARCGNDTARLEKLVPQLLTLHVISSSVTFLFYVSGILLLWNRIGDYRLVLFSLSFFVTNCFACEWYFMGREQFGFISLRSITVRLLGLLSIFILIRKPSDYFIYYGVIVGTALITASLNLAAMFSRLSFRLRKVEWKQHLRYVWVTYLISLFYSIPLLLDNVLVGLVSTAAVVGIYSFSVKMVRIGSLVLTDSFLVFFPRIVSLASQQEHAQLLQKLSLNIQFIIVFAIPMGMGLYLVSDDIALLFYGEKFLDTAANLRILALFPLVKGVSLFLSNPVLIAQHREKAVLRNLVLSGLLFVPLALILSRQYAATGACVALIVTESFLLVLNLVSVRRYFPAVRLNPLVLLQAVVAALVFIPVVLFVRPVLPAGPAGLGLLILTCILIYFSLLLVFRNELVLAVGRLVAGRFPFEQKR